MTMRLRISRSLRLQFAIAAGLMGITGARSTQAALLFDNISPAQAGGTLTSTGSTPNTFMGDGYVLASGATDITGFDLFPLNLTGTTFTGLKINFDVWGTVNTGTVSATTPAFGNLLGAYTLTATGSFASGFYYSFQTSTPGVTSGVTLGTPLQLGASTTIGMTFNYQGTTDGTTYNNVNSLTSVIAYGSAPTTGSDVFNGYYRNANSETNGNFTSSLRTLGYTNQSVAVRIYGDIASTSKLWTNAAGGSWEVATNWNPASVPVATDSPIFNLATNGLTSAGYTVTLPGAEVSNNLYVQSDRVTLDLPASTSSLTLGGALTVGQPATSGNSNFGFLTLTNSAALQTNKVTANSVVVGGNGGTGSLTIGSGVSLVSTTSTTVNASSVLMIAPGGKLSTNSLVIAGTANFWTGQVDITNNVLDLPAGVLATVTNQAKTGYDLAGGGIFDGQGITSSTAANDTTHLTAVGVIQNNQGGSAIYTATNKFAGLTPGPSDVLVKYTYFGDANLDGVVNGADYSLIDNAYNKALAGTILTGWYNGDFNYDGVVDGSDYTLIDNSFNTQGASLLASGSAQIDPIGSAAVPEPATAGLAIICAAGALGRRRRA